MKKIIKTSKAPAPIGPYNQAVLSGDMLYTSGQIAINPKTGKLEIGDIRSGNKTGHGKLESCSGSCRHDF